MRFQSSAIQRHSGLNRRDTFDGETFSGGNSWKEAKEFSDDGVGAERAVACQLDGSGIEVEDGGARTVVRAHANGAAVEIHRAASA